MNQDQRKYLVAAVEKQGCLQRKKLQDQLTVKPSLNNYLTAAFLDNSIQFADIGELKKKMRIYLVDKSQNKISKRTRNC